MVARREQRTRRGHVGGQGVGLRPLAQRPGPRVAPHVEHRRDPGAEVGPEEALGMGAQAGLHRVVRELRPQIQAVGAPVGPARLGEVDVRIHEARGQPEARDVQGRDPRRNGALCPRARAVDRPSPHQHHRIGHHGAAASIDERGPHQGTRRRGSPRRGHEPGGHRDLPAFGGLEEQALGDPLVLLLAHEGAHPVGTVHEAGTDAHELQVLGLEGVGPASLGRLRGQRLEADLHPFVARPGEGRGLQVAGEVGLAVLVLDRGQVLLEDGARAREIAGGGGVLGRRGRGCGGQDEQHHGGDQADPRLHEREPIPRQARWKLACLDRSFHLGTPSGRSPFKWNLKSCALC